MSQQKKQEYVSLPFFGIGKILPYTKKFRKTQLAMILFGLCGTLVDIEFPLLQRYALNHFVGGGTLDTIWYFIPIYVASIIFAALVNYAACFRAMFTEVGINRDLRNAAFDHLQTLSFSYYNQNSVGYIHARVMQRHGAHRLALLLDTDGLHLAYQRISSARSASC